MHGKEMLKIFTIVFQKPMITMEYSINRHSIGNKKTLINTQRCE